MSLSRPKLFSLPLKSDLCLNKKSWRLLITSGFLAFICSQIPWHGLLGSITQNVSSCLAFWGLKYDCRSKSCVGIKVISHAFFSCFFQYNVRKLQLKFSRVESKLKHPTISRIAPSMNKMKERDFFFSYVIVTVCLGVNRSWIDWRTLQRKLHYFEN